MAEKQVNQVEPETTARVDPFRARRVQLRTPFSECGGSAGLREWDKEERDVSLSVAAP